MVRGGGCGEDCYRIATGLRGVLCESFESERDGGCGMLKLHAFAKCICGRDTHLKRSSRRLSGLGQAVRQFALGPTV